MKLTEGPDAGATWHYGDPFREQRALVAGTASVDLSHRPVFTISGADRLRWLNDITSQDFAALAPGVPTLAYILDAHGHLTHVFGARDDGTTLWCHTEPGHLEPLLGWLRRMVFAARVEIDDVGQEYALVLPPAAVHRDAGSPPAAGGGPVVVPRDRVDATLGETRAGIWAMEAVRIASGTPRIFVDTDDRTIPNELANPDADALGPAVHLRKGCYPGQETVARVYNLGRPPRRLTLLHLDGSDDRLPPVGADVLREGRPVGRMGSSERHYELGPVGLALLKRTLAPDAELVVDGVAAAQEVIVSPEAGLHWRPEPGIGRG
ncbi:YgfZ/GcvT domain-containing protein [Propionicimonas sp.]|uniref:CAF17-like 4Fe-4S cluster assembly/insertion protein YgfZ n=1 Tax=Propionicimonas sp. TaxID=1955623 RepID=UPI0039E4DFC1